MAQSIDLKNVKHIRLTCDHATIDGLSLEMDLSNSNKPKAAGSVAVSSPLVAKDLAEDGKYHLLLAASGSVATIKIPNIVKGLGSNAKLAIRIVLTKSAAQFLQGQSEEQPDLEMLASLPNVEAVYQDEDEWRTPWTRGAPILHIELRRWANLLVIAPLSANTLAKLSGGFCDNLLTSVVRAWEVQPWTVDSENSSRDGSSSDLPAQKLIIVAPAMNTAMWRHPLTRSQLNSLMYPGPDQAEGWIRVLWPIEKELACGDTGDGAMTDWNNIVSNIESEKAAYFHTRKGVGGVN